MYSSHLQWTIVYNYFIRDTVSYKSFTVRKLSRFSRIFIKPRKFSLLNFCSSENSDMYEGGDWKNRETFPRIPDEPSKPRNFSPSKLLSFAVTIYIVLISTIMHLGIFLDLKSHFNLTSLLLPKLQEH